jgi:hypothetical protein
VEERERPHHAPVKRDRNSTRSCEIDLTALGSSDEEEELWQALEEELYDPDFIDDDDVEDDCEVDEDSAEDSEEGSGEEGSGEEGSGEDGSAKIETKE